MTGAELLERSAQQGELDSALRMVLSSGLGRVVLVAGDAGIGKTSLLRTFCAEPAGPARVLWASCEPLCTPRPLGAISDLAGVLGTELTGLVAAHATPYDVAAWLLRELAAVPSVLVVDDLHWADEATLDVLRVVARRVASIPVLLVLTYRDSELDEAHPLRVVLGDLPGSDRTVRLELACLSERAVAELARAAEPAPVAPGPGLAGFGAAELYELTGGNPFYVTEVLAAGVGRVPRSVRDAVLARAARLGPSVRDLLARLAHHAMAAGDADAVLRHVPAAAAQAAAAGARREATGLYARAMRFAPGQQVTFTASRHADRHGHLLRRRHHPRLTLSPAGVISGTRSPEDRSRSSCR